MSRRDRRGLPSTPNLWSVTRREAPLCLRHLPPRDAGGEGNWERGERREGGVSYRLPLAEDGRGDADGLLVGAEVEGAGEA